MTRSMPSHDIDSLKVRHFLLQAKAQADIEQRQGRASSLTDAEVRELMESIWIAERARENPDCDLVKLARNYRLVDWATRLNSPDEMGRALSRASSFYDNTAPAREPLLI